MREFKTGLFNDEYSKFKEDLETITTDYEVWIISLVEGFTSQVEITFNNDADYADFVLSFNDKWKRPINENI